MRTKKKRVSRNLAGTLESHIAAEQEAAQEAEKYAERVHKSLSRGQCASALSDLIITAGAVGQARAERTNIPKAALKKQWTGGTPSTPLMRAGSALTSAQAAFNLTCLVPRGED